MIKYNDNMVVLAIIIVIKMLKRTFFSLTNPPEDELNPKNIKHAAPNTIEIPNFAFDLS